MFAVVKTGGKQYKVAKNDVIKVEILSQKEPASEGEVILLEDVLAYNDGKTTTLGSPSVAKVAVAAEVIEQKKDDKVIVFKKKRRHNYRRKVGHRQQVLFLRIQDIGEGLKAKAAPAKAKPAAEKKAETAEKPAAKKAAPKAAAEKKSTAKPAAKKAPAKKTEAKK